MNKYGSRIACTAVVSFSADHIPASKARTLRLPALKDSAGMVEHGVFQTSMQAIRELSIYILKRVHQG
ncbi:MAG: hypothetical protein HY788_17215 [Deltaproteobacteria bacterium]|nr:hypothetical protein [Deltaproteobacteria bacterium]